MALTQRLHSAVLPNFFIFTARCYASAVLAMALCLSVRPSVRPSQVGVLLKRLNVGSHKQHHTIAQRLDHKTASLSVALNSIDIENAGSEFEGPDSTYPAWKLKDWEMWTGK